MMDQRYATLSGPNHGRPHPETALLRHSRAAPHAIPADRAGMDRRRPADALGRHPDVQNLPEALPVAGRGRRASGWLEGLEPRRYLSGPFFIPQSYDLGAYVPEFHPPAVADFNGDGNPDVLVPVSLTMGPHVQTGLQLFLDDRTGHLTPGW